MPIFDPIEQRMSVRIVYDGVACAGKTTNLRHLSALFAAQRVSELESPAELHGRTLYFDWLQIEAGVVCGIPLSCQVLSVPGQVVLTPRRRGLLATADVVVYVCDSHPSAIASARAGLELYDRIAKAREAPLPLVLQANKQDGRDVLDGVGLSRALGRPGVPVVEAIACDGVGVVDSFVTAVRTVARALQTRVEERSLRVDVRRAETAAELFDALAAEELDPEWAAEMLLEEAQAAFMVEEAVATVRRDGALRARLVASGEDLRRVERAPSEAPRAVEEAEPPLLPTHDVPTGFIWPAHTGRAVLRGLALAAEPPRSLGADGSIVHVVDRHVVRTSARARFADGEAARQALVRAARMCTQLGRLHVPDTVLVAQTARDGGCWIWNVRPDLPSIARLQREGFATPEVLVAYAYAMVEAMRAALRHGFSIDLSMSSFGLQQGMLRYLGDVWPDVAGAAQLTSSIAASVDALERAGVDVTAFLDALERELSRRVPFEDRSRAAAPPPSGDLLTKTRSPRERLAAMLDRAGEAT